jgi:hypothetical protein
MYCLPSNHYSVHHSYFIIYDVMVLIIIVSTIPILRCLWKKNISTNQIRKKKSTLQILKLKKILQIFYIQHFVTAATI